MGLVRLGGTGFAILALVLLGRVAFGLTTICGSRVARALGGLWFGWLSWLGCSLKVLCYFLESTRITPCLREGFFGSGSHNILVTHLFAVAFVFVIVIAEVVRVHFDI